MNIKDIVKKIDEVLWSIYETELNNYNDICASKVKELI